MTGEFELIARLAKAFAAADARVAVPQGDDAAVVRVGGVDVCVAVDVLVQDVHFRWDLSSPADVGWKALAVNVSDIAAMGAQPLAAVVGLTLPPTASVTAVEALYEGLAAAARAWDVRLVGGDTTRGPVLVVSVTILGIVTTGRAVTRSGARPGDAVVVVGALGGAAAALALDAAGARPPFTFLASHRRPRALPAAGRVLAEHGATAMIDVSDGLGADLTHICAASGTRVRINFDVLPLAPGVDAAAARAGVDLAALVCGGGEDLALAATVPAVEAERAARRAGEVEGVPAAVIGEVLRADGGPRVTLVRNGRSANITGLGWDHLSSQAAPRTNDWEGEEQE